MRQEADILASDGGSKLDPLLASWFEVADAVERGDHLPSRDPRRRSHPARVWWEILSYLVTGEFIMALTVPRGELRLCTVNVGGDIWEEVWLPA